MSMVVIHQDLHEMCICKLFGKDFVKKF